MRERLTSKLGTYLIAVAIMAAAVVGRWLLDPWLGERLTLITTFWAVAAAVWIGGYGPALLAALLGYLACDVLFIEPRGSLSFLGVLHLAGFIAYSVTCFVIIGIAEALRISRRRSAEGLELLRVTLQSIGDAVITTDTRGRVTALNAVAASLTGWRQAQAAGKPLGTVFRIVNELSGEEVENPAERVLREGKVVGLANHSVLISRDGSRRPIDDSAAPILDQEGRLAGCVLVFRDVSERRQAEQALRASEAQFRALSENIPQQAWMAQPDGSLFWYNRRWFEYTGTTLERMQGWGWREVHHPAHVERVVERFRGSLASGEPWEDTFPLRREDGSYRWFLSRAFPIRDDGGAITCWFGTNTDITELLDIQEELRRSQQRLELALQASGAVTWGWDLAEKRLDDWSPDYRRLYGFGAEEVASVETWLARVHPQDAERVSARLEEIAAARGDDLWDVEFRIQHPARGERWLRGRGRCLRDGSGRPLRLTGVDFDITDRKLVERQLLEADRRKDEFLATLSHELRNPLAPIRSAVQVVLATAPADPGLRRSGEVIDRQVRQMARLLDDLLDVARISHDKLELRRQRVELAAVVQSAVESSQPQLEGEGRRLTISLPREPLYLDADPVRLAQVFANLLSNAAKYTGPGGRIRLRAERQDGGVEVSVEDDGIGIAPGMLPRIFDMFSQGPATPQRFHEGLGIGLALVRSLVELHGGSVEAHSSGPGAGSTFTVRVPLVSGPNSELRQPAPAAGDPECKTPPDRRRRLLIADDRRDSADSLAMLLELQGHEVRTTYDGEEAVAVAESFRPEVILLDIGMPKLDGYGACRRIRSQPWAERVFLIAITGWGQERDHQRSREAGFDHHLLKPVDPQALVRLLATLP